MAEETKTIVFTKRLAQQLYELVSQCQCKNREDLSEMAIFLETMNASLDDWRDGQSKDVVIPVWIGQNVAELLANTIDRAEMGLPGGMAILAMKMFQEFEQDIKTE